MRIVEYDTRYIGKYPSDLVAPLIWDTPTEDGSSQPSDLMVEVVHRSGWPADWLYKHTGPKGQPGRYAIFPKLEKQLTALMWAADGNLQDKRILDLGCGARGGMYEGEHGGYGLGNFEPWLARTLHQLGVKVVGVDVGRVNEEPFEAHLIDLLKPDGLEKFTAGQFDIVHSSALYSSPELSRRFSSGQWYERDGSLDAAERLATMLLPQIKRITKDDGTYVFREDLGYLFERQYHQPPIHPLRVFTPRLILEDILDPVKR